MRSCIATIDAGTGGVRCVIFDETGTALCEDYREMPTSYGPGGRAEQDPVQLVRSAFDAVRGALLRGNADAARIAGVVVTGTQTTFVPLDADGRCLTNMILWQDARGLEMLPQILARLAASGMSESDLYRRTLRPLDALLAGAKLLWLREREPGIYGRIHRLANPQALLSHAFGAPEITVDPSDGGWWLSHDAVTLEVDPELIGLFGLDPRHFPTLVDPGAQIGRVSSEAAVRTGLLEGTPIFQGAVDQCCAALGAGNDGRGSIGTLCLGTAGVVMRCGPEIVPDPLERYYVLHYPAGGYAHEIAVPVAASAFRWVRDVLYPGSAARTADVYRSMDAEAMRSPVGANGLVFLPHLAGSIYPDMNADIRGGWLGASLASRRADLIRAALEGICYGRRRIMEAAGCRFETLRLLGGATRSEFWNRMQADVYGCPVETVCAREASALGAAMIAAAGAGLYESLPRAVRAMTSVKRRYEPDPDSARRYDACYRAWQACLDGLTPRAFETLAGLR